MEKGLMEIALMTIFPISGMRQKRIIIMLPVKKYKIFYSYYFSLKRKSRDGGYRDNKKWMKLIYFFHWI